ncbi:MAG: PhoH family protein [Methanothrix sp.]|jgi:PhoH-like ATPase|nr:PhoH family protein [Methanothrix sp.]
MQERTVFCDTNVLLSDRFNLDDYKKVYISIASIEELDGLKKSEDVGYKVRRIIKELKDADNVEYVLYEQGNLAVFEEHKNDNRILQMAYDTWMNNKDKDVLFLTDDYNLLVKAKSIKLPCEMFEFKECEELYKGYKIIELSEIELANWYESEVKSNIWDLRINEYALFKVNNVIVDKYRWTSEGFIKVKAPNIKGIKPLNDLQQCAFDLTNNEVPIKIILGKVGSGKTLVNIRSAIHLLDKGKFQRIMYLRNPVGKGRNIGFLPGNKLEKLLPFCSSIIDNLDGGEIQFQQMIMQDKLLVECSYYIKGASKENTWFCLDEGEDLDIETLKLIGTRVAKNSVLCISADLDQTEKEYKHNNGLKEFVEKFKGNPLVGIITLKDDVRSEVSKLFGEF